MVCKNICTKTPVYSVFLKPYTKVYNKIVSVNDNLSMWKNILVTE